MDINGFRESLENDPNITSKTKAVNSRVSKASSVEKMFRVNLDFVVKDDVLMGNGINKININATTYSLQVQFWMLLYYK